MARDEWVTLNRLRTGHGRSGAGGMLHKRKMRDRPDCDYGLPYNKVLPSPRL